MATAYLIEIDDTNITVIGPFPNRAAAETFALRFDMRNTHVVCEETAVPPEDYDPLVAQLREDEAAERASREI